MRTPIEDAWQRLVASTGKSLPRGQQRERLRAAFFAGVGQMVGMIQNTAPQELEGLVDAVYAELEGFTLPTKKRER